MSPTAPPRHAIPTVSRAAGVGSTFSSRRQVWPRAFAALRPGGTLFVIGHDSSNLSEGVGGPQDPDCLYVSDDVLDALHTDDLLIEEAGRVPRVTEAGTAYDVLVKVRRS